MNKQRFIFILTVCLFLPVMYAADSNSLMSRMDDASDSDIILAGELKSGSLRSGGDALTAEIDGSTILLTFNNNVGNVLVRITNRYGNTVYSGTVNSNSGYAVISLSGLPSGTYTITFSNGNGTMWGQFSI